MAEIDYIDFDLLIERLGEGKYRSRVLSSPAGQALHEFAAPFSNLELENFFLRIGRPKQGVRRIDSPEMQAAKSMGTRLFEAVFNDEVYASFKTSLNASANQGKGLRIRLRLDSPELNDFPWEYLYNPSLNSFLSLAVDTPVIRYIDLPYRSQALTVKPPLKILVMICSPFDYQPLDVENEWDKLRTALNKLEQRGLVSLERLAQPSLSGLQRQLREKEYQIFHFIGHGIFDSATQEGMLLIEDENGRGRPISGQYIGALLHNHRSFRLAILNACEGARTSQSDPFSGVAHSLVQQGLPAVIAMQFEITDKAAITFSKEFYAAIADGYSVDAALAEARCAIFSQGNDIEWGTPVCFTRLRDGRVFKKLGEISAAKAARPEVERPVVEAQPYVDVELQHKLEQLYTKGLSAYWLEEWDQASHNFQLVLEINPDYQDTAEKLAEVNRQLKLKNLYEQALASFENHNYPEAVTAFEELVAEAPDYKEAAAKLQAARKQGMVADLYNQAKQLYQAQQWQAVINIFDRITELTPGFVDQEELLPTARHEFESQQCLAEITKRYQQGLQAMNSGKWKAAQSAFAQIQKDQPGFEDTERLLARAEAEIAKQEAQRRVQEQVGVLYEQAISLARARQWRQALEKMKEIDSLDAQFVDSDGIAARAKREIVREEGEAQRQNELAALYAEAVRLLKAGQYQEALDKWDEVKAIKPDYSDHHQVQISARMMLAAQTKLKTRKRHLSPRTKVILGIAGLALATIAIILGIRDLVERPPAPESTSAPLLMLGAMPTQTAALPTSTKPAQSVAKSTSTLPAPGSSGPFFAYERTFGETGVPYFADTDHLSIPQGVGVDGAGNLWVAETQGARVMKYSADGEFLMSIGSAGSVGVTDNYQFNTPMDVAVDGDGNIWVVDVNSCRVVKYDAEGDYLMQLGVTWEPGSDIDRFNAPSSVAFDSFGNIYVSDSANQRIQVFNSSATYNTTIGVTGESGSDNAHFNYPGHIAIDQDDNLYVADEGNQRVQIFDKNHSYSATVGVSGVEGSDNDHFRSPRGVAVDTDRIYVTDFIERVQIFDRATHTYVATLGIGGGSGAYEFLSPTDVTVDPSGNIYVADALNHRVQKFDSNLVFVDTFGDTGVPYLTDERHYNQPVDVAVAPSGNIAVIEAGGNRLTVLSANGDPQLTIGEAGVYESDNAHFTNPQGVAFDSNGKIYVADCNNHRMQIFNNRGVWIGKIGGADPGKGNYQFNCPTGVAIDRSGNIYISDAYNHRIQIYDSNFKYKNTLGRPGFAGSDNEHFNAPQDVAVDAEGSIYVADSNNHRVQKFNRNLVWLKTIGVAGHCNNDNYHFCSPEGVAVDLTGTVFVADKYNHRVQIFNQDGIYLATIGGDYGSQAGQFREPTGVGVDAEGNVYVAYVLDHQVVKFVPNR